jgi:parallel beta-helix repeat protein
VDLMKNSERIFSILFLLFFLILTVQVGYIGVSDNSFLIKSTIQQIDQKSVTNKIVTGMYTNHSRIEIFSESDFGTLGFSGIGSETDPYIIEGFNITETTEGNCINIQNIHAYVTIQNNYLDGRSNSQVCIYLGNVSHVKIIQNQFLNLKRGILLDKDCQYCEISGNTIIGSIDGAISLGTNSSFNNITNNYIDEASSGAIKVINSINCNIDANTVIGDMGDSYNPGIYIHNSIASIKNNIIAACYIGIYLEKANKSEIFNNYVNTSSRGIQVYGNENLIHENTVEFTSGGGIEVQGNQNIVKENRFYSTRNGIAMQGNGNSCTKNVIFNCTVYGINIMNPAENNLIKWNDFVWNGLSADSQGYAQDETGPNTITENYWDDFIYPDTNNDGIVDNPYIIPYGMYSNITDDSPLTTPYNSITSSLHYFNRPRIISISNSEIDQGNIILSGTVHIEWCPVTDSKGHTITYSVFYNSNDIWIAISEDLTENEVDWNTRDLKSSGGMCCLQFKVVAMCSDGLTAEYITGYNYGIENFSSTWNLPIFLFTLCTIAIITKNKRRK